MILNTLLVGFVIIPFISLCHGASRSGCSINVLGNANEKYLPVLLYNESSKFSLVIPDKGYIHLKSGQGMTFLCPENNHLIITNSNYTYATCVRDTTLTIFSTNYDFKDIICRKTIKGGIEKIKERCANGRGQIINIGYRVTPSYFKTLIKVCYDVEEGKTFYTEHIIHGNEVAYTSTFKERTSFSTEGLPPGVSAKVAYKKEFQKSTLSSLLGSSALAENYITTKSFLARGHLSPDADFLFASSQLTTYFYINVCPQWQNINGGNWVRVESAVRKAADKYQNDFLIITGTHEVLELPDNNGNHVPLYLVSRKKLPVPKFIWKIMIDVAKGKGIAFISLNNPFVDKIDEDDILCTDICSEYGWYVKSFGDLSKGLIYCCDVNELKQFVDTVPHVKVNGVLRGDI